MPTEVYKHITILNPAATGSGGQLLIGNDVSLADKDEQIEDELDALTAIVDGKANASHTHAILDITNLQTSLDGKAAAVHSHTISDVTALQTALDAKASASDLSTHLADTTAHGTTGNVVGTSDTQTLTNKTISGASNTISAIAISSITNLQTSLDLKANDSELGNYILKAGGTLESDLNANGHSLTNVMNVNGVSVDTIIGLANGALQLSGGQTMSGNINMGGNTLNMNDGSFTGGGNINTDGGSIEMGGGTLYLSADSTIVESGMVLNVNGSNGINVSSSSGGISLTAANGINLLGSTLNLNDDSGTLGGNINMDGGSINGGGGTISNISTFDFTGGGGGLTCNGASINMGIAGADGGAINCDGGNIAGIGTIQGCGAIYMFGGTVSMNDGTGTGGGTINADGGNIENVGSMTFDGIGNVDGNGASLLDFTGIQAVDWIEAGGGNVFIDGTGIQTGGGFLDLGGSYITGVTDITGSGSNVAFNSSIDMQTADILNAGRMGLAPQEEPPGTNGQIYYDSTTHKFRGYANGSWVDLH